jgi:hypothetical protein
MQTLQKQVHDFNSLIEHLRFEEAHNYYSDDIINVENEETPNIGLFAKIGKGKAFSENFTDISAQQKNSIISDDMSVTEWNYKFTNKHTGEKVDFNQLSLQRWKDGKIIHERHHYKTDKW